VQKWYQNKYIQALGVAVATGMVAACAVYLATMTDGMDARHTIKTVGTSFLGPFAVLVSVLPKITDIITPTVRIVGSAGTSLHESAAVAAEEEAVVTSEPVTTVVVGEKPPRLGKNPNAHVVPAVETEASKGTVT
jgi:hypothetical protein